MKYNLKKIFPFARIGALSLFPFQSAIDGLSCPKGTRKGDKLSLPHRYTSDKFETGRTLASEIQRIKSGCKECGLCAAECGFLQTYNLPGQIVRRWDFSKPEQQKIAFECNLCGLCKAVCPFNLNMADLLLEVRRKAISAGSIDLSYYAAILNYEKLGQSPLFSFYGLREGCNSVYFPGCAFAGTRRETAWKTFEYLRERDPLTGIVLDCCGKPSHDLGRQKQFEAAFGKICRRLEAAGVRQIIVNCPSCHQTFERYGKSFSVKTVYELIDENASPQSAKKNEILTIHDPCPMRFEVAVQESVRKIVSKMGFSVYEMPHSGNCALCCGEGASVRFVRPGLAEKWKSERKKECGGKKMVTYCAACAENLKRTTSTVHILDLFFKSTAPRECNSSPMAKVSAHFERLRLKHRLMKEFKSAEKS